MTRSSHAESLESDEEVALPEGTLVDDRYRIVDVLGAGGVGVVYRAEHLGLKRAIALKVLRQAFVEHASLRPRFEREARALSAMSHPNIVSVMDYGVAREGPYIVMELLHGRTLRSLMDEGPVETERALAITRDVLRALGYAHARGVLHRDIKPGNVFLQSLDRQGEHVKILDFGFAKVAPESGLSTGSDISSVDETFGTPAYMSPEQATSSHLDERADLYSVAVMLFEMLSGHKPYDGELSEIIRQHLSADVPALPEIDGFIARPELSRVVERALAKRPDDRFIDAGAFMEALERLPRPLRILPTSSSSSSSSSGDASVTRPTRLRRASGITGVVLAGLLGIVAIVAAMQVRAQRAADALARDAAGREASAGAASENEPRGDQALGGMDWNAVTDTNSDSNTDSVTALDTDSDSDSDSDFEPLLGSDTIFPPVLDLSRDPWSLHPSVPLLDDIRSALDAHDHLPERAVRQLRSYSRGNRGDPRPHLLMARIYLVRGWKRDVLARYELAVDVDPRVVEDPDMRRDIVSLIADRETSALAAETLVDIYDARAADILADEAAALDLDDAGLLRIAAVEAALMESPVAPTRWP